MKFVKYSHGIWQPYVDLSDPNDQRDWKIWESYMFGVFRDQYQVILSERQHHEIH